jgi:long-chain acyl-CoA synthetase
MAKFFVRTNVMMSYFKDEQLTSEVIKDGATYRRGRNLTRWFLKKLQIVKERCSKPLEENILPQIIENMMKQSRFIEQIMVGEGQNTCSIYPN